MPRSRTFRQVTHTVRTVLTSLVALTVLGSCSEDTERDGGAETIEIQDADVAFELSAAWVELDPAEAREALTDDDLMVELVERHGPDTKMFGPVEIFISTTGVPPPGPEPIFVASAKGVQNDVLPQMTVKVLSLDDLPSVAELEQHHRKTPSGSTTSTSLRSIPGLSQRSSAHSRRAPESRFYIGLNSPWTPGSDVMAISLVTDDRAKSEQLASDIADSLERTS